MAINTQAVTFNAKDISLSDVLGINLDDVELSLFSHRFADSGRFESFAINTDYQYDATIGMQLVVEAPSFGEIDMTYPLFAELELPDSIAAGESFSIGTTDNYYIKGAKLTGETVGFTELGLDLLLSTGVNGFSNISFGNALGGSLYELPTDLLTSPTTIDPIRLLTLSATNGLEGEIIDGIKAKLALPEGEEKTYDQSGRSEGALAPLKLEVRDPLASIEINPIERLTFTPSSNRWIS